MRAFARSGEKNFMSCEGSFGVDAAHRLRRRPLRRRPEPSDEDLRRLGLLLRRAPASRRRSTRRFARSTRPACADVAVALDVHASGALGDGRSRRSKAPRRERPKRVLFLEARRRGSGAPLQRDPPAPSPCLDAGSLREAIAAERRALAPLRERATIVLDTTDLTHAALKERIAPLPSPSDRVAVLAVTLVAFGFKYGIAARSRSALRRALPAQSELRRRAAAADRRRPDGCGLHRGRPAALGPFLATRRILLDFLLPRYVCRRQVAAHGRDRMHGRAPSVGLRRAPFGAHGCRRALFGSPSTRETRCVNVQARKNRVVGWLRWLLPGLGVKRWVLVSRHRTGACCSTPSARWLVAEGSGHPRQRDARRHRRRLLLARVPHAGSSRWPVSRSSSPASRLWLRSLVRAAGRRGDRQGSRTRSPACACSRATRSSRSAAAPASRRCCAASNAGPAISPRS